MRLAIVLFFLFGYQTFAQQFYNISSPSNGGFLHHEFTDIDQDGDEDYLVWTINKIKWYEQAFDFSNENIIYSRTYLSFPINKPLEDINNDGKKDLLFSTLDSLYALPNLGNGNFDTTNILNLGIANQSSSLYDLNNDGKLDKLMHLGQNWVYQLNQGNWTFDTSVVIIPYYSNLAQNHHPTVLDVNGDGYLDIAFKASYNNVYYQTRNMVLLNDGNGQFYSRPDLTFIDIDGQSSMHFNALMHQYDFDADGDLDLFYSTNMNVKCVTNLGDTAFAPPISIYSIANVNYWSNGIIQIHFVDIDFDNTPELQICKGAFNYEFYEITNNANLTPASQTQFLQTNALMQNMYKRDIDQDGQMDLVSIQNKPASYFPGKSIWHRNTSNINFNHITINVCDSFFVLSPNDTIYSSYQYLDTIAIDSVDNVNITFRNPIYWNEAKTICEGNTFTFGNQVLMDTGVYQHTFSNQYGCDSIVTLTLKKVPQPSQTSQYIETALCQYYLNGTTYYQDTTFTITYTTAYDCDSIVEYTLDFILPPLEEDQYEEVVLGTFVPHPQLHLSYDFDNDGDLDILTTSGLDSNILYILEQTSPGYYKKMEERCPVPIEFIKTKDINNDGVEDIALSRHYGVIFHSCGRQLSNYQMEMSWNTYPNKYVDINSDGILDEIVFSPRSYYNLRKISLKINIKNAYGISRQYHLMDDFGDAYSPLWASYDYGYLNQDSILDFIVYTKSRNNNTKSFLYAYISDSNLNYTKKTLHSWFSRTYYATFIGSASIVDQNQDGLDDIIYNINNGQGTIAYNRIIQLLNNGNPDSVTFHKEALSAVDPIGYCEPMENNQLISSISSSIIFANKSFVLSLDSNGGCKLEDNGLGGLGGSGVSGERGAVSVLGNFDGDFDGDKDIVFGTYMMRNNNDTSYDFVPASPIFAPNFGPSYLEDIDNDGDFDLVYQNGMKWAPRINQTTIGPQQDLLTFDQSLSAQYIGLPIKKTDFDNDGDDDVIGYYRDKTLPSPFSWHSRFLLLLENDGTGQLSYHSTLDTVKYDFIQVADINQDGSEDIFLKNGWLKNTGNLNFSYQIYNQGIESPQIIMDHNQDGKVDLLTKKDSVIAWYYNDGFENFTLGKLVTNKATTQLQKLRVYDFEGDGDLDVYAHNQHIYNTYQFGNRHSLYLNPTYNLSIPENPKQVVNEFDFSVSPNPSRGNFSIHSPDDLIVMNVYNTQGKLMATKKLHKGQNQVDLQGLIPSGMYLLRLTKPGVFSKTTQLMVVN
ncbi:MAG: T9SS type A sorting domain-containing protein [Flavobacteriales bacterium]|jgi:hypothetical protein|nr:T9SS type A sorting domain-containing protein [Flavobacteriales bacterium]